MPEVKNRMFTLHPLFTTYHSEIKGENQRVNSVNSSFEKKFFMWIKDALVWIRATDPNLLIKNDLTFRFIDGLKIDWSEKQWGHKRGHISLLCFIICFLSLTYFDVWVRPSHHTVCKSSRSRAAFFVSEITHIRAVYRPARKAVQYSSFCSRWSQVCSGWKLHRPHYVGRVVSLCYLNVLTMWLR